MLDVYLIRLQKNIPLFRKKILYQRQRKQEERREVGKEDRGKERKKEKALKQINFQSAIPKQCCIIF